MGMDYYIITSPELMDDSDFPEGLSYFFEQIGGYDKYSMVSQLEKILTIDLSLFQNIDHSQECDDTTDPVWQNIQSVIEKIVEFKTSLNSNADYAYKVKFNSEHPHSRLKKIADERRKSGTLKSEFEVLDEIMNGNIDPNDFGDENRNYPPDTGYLREGRLMKDLDELEMTLKALKTNGIDKIKFLYL